MARTDAFYKNNGIFINAAIIGAYANSMASDTGFRQRDIKFYIDLLSNWMETTIPSGVLNIQNTQIQRILDSLVTEGFLRKTQKNDVPYYGLKSLGLIEIVSRLVEDDGMENLDQFFFVYHFVLLYSSKMNSMLLEKNNTISKAYQLEVENLLNSKNLVQRQIEKIQFKIVRLEDRINECRKMSKLAKGYFEKNLPLKTIVEKIEKLYPYQLNNQKNMNELFAELSPDMQLIELTEAPAMRADSLWEPLLNHYKSYLNILKSLA